MQLFGEDEVKKPQPKRAFLTLKEANKQKLHGRFRQRMIPGIEDVYITCLNSVLINMNI